MNLERGLSTSLLIWLTSSLGSTKTLTSSSLARVYAPHHRWLTLYREADQARHASQHAQLEDAIRLYLKVRNEKAKPFVWVKTADQILASIARFCQRTCVPGH
jgi:hypothetical protein